MVSRFRDGKLMGNGETLLVVEDEPDLRALLSRMLESLGYRVIEAEDGPSALHRLDSSTSVELLISDFGLPHGMDGGQLAARVREQYPDLPVLLITGHICDSAGNFLDAQGSRNLLRKPFRKEDLAGKVRDTLTQALGRE